MVRIEQDEQCWEFDGEVHGRAGIEMTQFPSLRAGQKWAEMGEKISSRKINN
jgi:hypothetical protein